MSDLNNYRATDKMRLVWLAQQRLPSGKRILVD